MTCVLFAFTERDCRVASMPRRYLVIALQVVSVQLVCAGFVNYYGEQLLPIPYIQNVPSIAPNTIFNYNFIPQPQTQLLPRFIIRAPLATVAESYYSPENIQQGFSYQLKYEDGGKSKVSFMTGPNAKQLLQKSLEFFDTIVPRITKEGSNESISENSTTSSSNEIGDTTAFRNTKTSQIFLQIYPGNTYPFPGLPVPIQSYIFPEFDNNNNDTEDATEVKPAEAENEGEAQESMVNEVKDLPLLNSFHQTLDDPKENNNSNTSTNGKVKPEKKALESESLDLQTSGEEARKSNEGTTVPSTTTEKTEKEQSTENNSTIMHNSSSLVSSANNSKSES